jgi:hypothetical protein
MVSSALYFIDGDSLGESSKLMIINHTLLYRWKRNVACDVLGSYGVGLITENIQMVSLSVGAQADNTLRVRVYCSAAQRVESQTEGSGANWAGRHPASVAEFRFNR